MLKIEDIVERLRIKDSGVVDDIYNTAFALLKEEQERMNVIDTKSNYIIGIAGIAISLLFTFGKDIYTNIFNYTLLTILYFATLGLFLASLIIAVFVIKPRTYKGINLNNLLNKDETEKEKKIYRRFMAAHILDLFQNNYSVNETKGRVLKWAHTLLILAAIFLIPLFMCLHYIN